MAFWLAVQRLTPLAHFFCLIWHVDTLRSKVGWSMFVSAHSAHSVDSSIKMSVKEFCSSCVGSTKSMYDKCQRSGEEGRQVPPNVVGSLSRPYFSRTLHKNWTAPTSSVIFSGGIQSGKVQSGNDVQTLQGWTSQTCRCHYKIRMQVGSWHLWHTNRQCAEAT